jgi:protein SCO1/2
MLAAVCVIAAACEHSPPAADKPHAPVAAPEAPSNHTVFGPGETVPGVSIYDLPAPLTDQEGEAVGLDVFRGHLVLISMFYTTCPQACPVLVSHIKRIEAALDPAVRADLRVLLVSFDPDHDTTAVLNDAVQHFGVDAMRWKFTRTDEEHVREIGAVLGIKYRQADGSFNHSSVITLLDRTGVIDRRADGMGDAVASMGARIAELAQVKAGSSPERSHSPATGSTSH